MQQLRALRGDQPLFTFEAAAGTELRVVRFSGSEAISELFEFRLELAGGELDIAAVIGVPATLTIGGIEAPRHVAGALAAFEYVGQSRRHQLYEAVLVPWIWRLQHRRDCRVFQDKSTPDILKSVLTAAGLTGDGFRFDLLGEHPPRNYCVQYGESDLAFISRLMEDAGIFYYFEHSAERHVLVMADHPGAHPPIPGVPLLWFSPPDGMVTDQEHVRQFRFGERMQPGKVSLRDFNLHKPGQAMEAGETSKVNGELEVYDYPGGYQDPGYGGSHQGKSRARVRLEALNAHRRAGSGSSDSPRLTVGHTLQLRGHPWSDLDGEYRVTRVTHSGEQPQVLDNEGGEACRYTNEFTVTERSQPYRPPAVTGRPVMRGLQTATVVGPAGEEVHTDEHGRVKVQFHWDRADAYDETSSCWVRVSQLWAGTGWGTLFLPRIGHEVLIDFIEGDPDRPVVTGRVYHGDNRPPYPLPAEKTKTTIKSDSSPGGGGFNELRFEDRKGAEEMFLHAQRDLNEVVLHDNSRTVTANQTFSVGANQSFSITKNRSVTVTEGDESLTVQTGKSTTTIEMNRSVTVKTGDSSLSVETGTHTETVKQAISVKSTDANVDVTAQTDLSLTAATATLSATAETDLSLTSNTATLKATAKTDAAILAQTGTLTAGAHKAVAITSLTETLSLTSLLNASLTSMNEVHVAAPLGVHVNGGLAAGVGANKIIITGNEEITLQVGGSAITLKADGITVSGPKITSTAIGMHEISGALIKIN